MNRYKMICANCGGDSVFRDACVEWDKDTQEWELIAVYDNATCGDCDGDTKIISEEIPA